MLALGVACEMSTSDIGTDDAGFEISNSGLARESRVERAFPYIRLLLETTRERLAAGAAPGRSHLSDGQGRSALWP